MSEDLILNQMDEETEETPDEIEEGDTTTEAPKEDEEGGSDEGIESDEA
ncbi:MAG: hypothetical protein HY764_03910 [Candidatus Portnoybacteria bacterium]|nr:hypothetical protein [Candidatus Portnoybacteria bacterium]